MDKLPFQGELMTREEALAMLEEMEGKSPEEFDGVLAGGHTARAVVVGLLRTIVRVSVLEEKLAGRGGSGG